MRELGDEVKYYQNAYKAVVFERVLAFCYGLKSSVVERVMQGTYRGMYRYQGYHQGTYKWVV
jgi:hypothetical protein